MQKFYAVKMSGAGDSLISPIFQTKDGKHSWEFCSVSQDVNVLLKAYRNFVNSLPEEAIVRKGHQIFIIETYFV
jgi:hypothetical protein